ncbi:MAG: beta-ketoacyl-[acyl-carrier-protein] synthase family protein [Acidobacteriota bacterium]
MSGPGAHRDVVVTGLGVVSALGSGVDANWRRLLAGQTGLGPIEGFDVAGNTVTQGGGVDMSPLDAHQKGKLRRADRTVRLAVEASRQALIDAGWMSEDSAGDDALVGRDVANLWGCGCGPCGTLYQSNVRFAAKGAKGMRPSTVPSCMANSISAGVSIQFGLRGTNQVIVSACTSSTNAIGQGFRWIRHGYADAVLCGGVEAFFDPFYYGVWNNLGVLSTLPDAESALRPFDRDRAGTLLGEGAGALLLESAEHAAQRGAALRGTLLGYGETSDGTHLTAPSVDGQAEAIRRALSDAGAAAEDLVYINAHGTATAANDTTECRSIAEALGDAGAKIPVGASKSYFGHTLGASGALESIVTLLALEHRTAPANLNLDHADPDCTATFVGREPQPLAHGLAMKNSFGFGGGNGVLIFGPGRAP